MKKSCLLLSLLCIAYSTLAARTVIKITPEVADQLLLTQQVSTVMEQVNGKKALAIATLMSSHTLFATVDQEDSLPTQALAPYALSTQLERLYTIGTVPSDRKTGFHFFSQAGYALAAVSGASLGAVVLTQSRNTERSAFGATTAYGIVSFCGVVSGLAVGGVLGHLDALLSQKKAWQPFLPFVEERLQQFSLDNFSRDQLRFYLVPDERLESFMALVAPE